MIFLRSFNETKTGKLWSMMALTLVMCLLSGGCLKRTNYEPKFGAAFNGTRLKVGLPVLAADWTFEEQGNDFVCWRNPEAENSSDSKPLHWLKTVKYDASGSPLTEVDQYSSGRSYLSGDPDGGHVFEECFITFDFIRYSRGLDPWTCNIAVGPDKGEHSLDEAKKIIEKWGIDWKK